MPGTFKVPGTWKHQNVSQINNLCRKIEQFFKNQKIIKRKNMLVLTRKENEKIRIGKDIILNIISTSDSSIRIGIEAPKTVKIFREEIYQSIKEHATQATVNSNKVLGTNYKALKLNKIKTENSKANAK